MRKFLLGLLFSGMVVAVAAPPGIDGTWLGATTHQFFPTIIKVLLGNGFALIPSQAFNGDCSDGDFSTTAGTTTTLTRDMFYNNLTITNSGNINASNQRIFWCGTLDLTNANANAIFDNGGVGGGGGNGGAAGGAGSNTGAGTNLTGRAGAAGGAGGTTTGTIGGAGSSGNVVSNSSGGSSGAGGTGSAGNTGGAGRALNTGTNFPMRDITTWFLPTTGSGTQVFTGSGGNGGGGGGGDGTSSGSGGGGGGASGQTIYLSGHIFKTGGTTAAGAIQASGGAGGAGGTPSATCTSGCGGGGGGSGGGGGWVVFKFDVRTGTAVTNILNTAAGSGGAGGVGKNGGTTGVSGNASPATAGLIQILNLSTGAMTTSTSGTASL